MLWSGWRGAAYSMSKKLLSSLLPFWRDWFLDIFFKKFLLPSTMVLFFHSFGGGWCFILVLLDHPSFVCHSNLFQSTIHYRSLLPYFEGGGQLGLGLFPCRILHCPHWFLAGGIDSIYLLKKSPLSSIIVLPTVLLRRLNSLLLSKYYPSILWWGGFACFLALLPYPPWFPLWGVAVSINSQTLLYHPSLPYHIILWRGAQLGLFPPQMLFYPHSFPLSSLTLLHFSLKVLISIPFQK